MPRWTSSTERGSRPPGPARLEVGRIVKPHGVRGELVVDASTNRAEARFASGAAVWVGGRRCRVVDGRAHQRRWIVRLEGVDDRNSAEALRGQVIEAEPLDEPGTLWVHDLVGCPVVTRSGDPVGTVEAVEANPASDLLIIDGGILVPLTFVVDVDDGRITVDVPDGLLPPGS